MTDDVNGPIVAFEFKIAMVRCQPAVKDFQHLNFSLVEKETARRLFAPVSGITLYSDNEHVVGFALSVHLVVLLLNYKYNIKKSVMQKVNFHLALCFLTDLKNMLE